MLKKNLIKVVEDIREIEVVYRIIVLFFKNIEIDKVKNVMIVNVDLE